MVLGRINGRLRGRAGSRLSDLAHQPRPLIAPVIIAKRTSVTAPGHGPRGVSRAQLRSRVKDLSGNHGQYGVVEPVGGSRHLRSAPRPDSLDFGGGFYEPQ